MSSTQQLQQGRLFPPLSQIRQACEQLTAHLAQFMVKSGLGRLPEGVVAAPRDVLGWLDIVRQHCFAPDGSEGVAAAAGGAGGNSQQQQQWERQLVVARSRL
jgi:hypothetical protein